MRLVSVSVRGYRRFGAASEIKVDGAVIAIVGPNEAGKTSLLRGLEHLNDSQPFTPQDKTRSGADSLAIAARFLIEESDRAALASLPGIDQARWYVLARNEQGLVHHIEPTGVLKRNREPRQRAAERLGRASRHQALEDPDQPEQPSPLSLTCSSLAGDLASDVETLAEDVMERIRSVAEAWPEFHRAPKYVSELGAELARLHESESAPPPNDQALDFFDRESPSFQWFGANERELRSDYDLNEVAGNPPAGLANLIALAHLDLVRLRDSIAAQEYGAAEKLVEDANERLLGVFEQSWRQAGVTVRIRNDEHVLRILISSDDGGYTQIAERSDGLRAFIALLAFTALQSDGPKPVLLIDEAESHLHYDAQADLIRVFSRQDAAEKVIYTTHSAGCLPDDLGAVRVVVPEEGTSRIRNAFWEDEPGLSPLLIGMGASALAFASARYAVIAEGGSDLVLLPSLLREAVGTEFVGFQVAPGLSEVRPADVPTLDLQAARVAYLVDGDKAGRRLAAKLTKGGVPGERVVSHGADRASGLVLEDYIDPAVYCEAVTRELNRSGLTTEAMPQTAVGSKPRDAPAAVKAWCRTRGLDPPNKVAVAYRVLDIQSEGRSIVANVHRAELRATYAAIASVLGLPATAGS